MNTDRIYLIFGQDESLATLHAYRKHNMPPKRKRKAAAPRKVTVPREPFLKYSADAHKKVDRVAQKQARQEADTVWKGLEHDVQERFHEAHTVKAAAQAALAPLKVAVKKAQTSKTKLANAEGDDRDERAVVAAFDHLLDCQTALLAAHRELETKSRHFTNIVNSIYTRQALLDYAEVKHGEIITAANKAETDAIEINKGETDLGLPATSDGEIKIPQEWLPDVKRDQQKDYMKRKFLYEPFVPGIPTLFGWHGGWPAGGGGHSTTGVWFEDDGNGNIANRVFRKDTSKEAAWWADFNTFDNTDFQAAREDPRLLVPMEVACHRDLSSIPGTILGQSVAIPNLRRFKVEVENERYIMYLDYCGRGNLRQLIEDYSKSTSEELKHIPEPFLWRIFLALAVTGYAMEKGTLDRSDENPEWKQIVHRDLKTQNNFLDEPTPEHFHSYPAVRVGDFGIAVKTSESDILNPTTFYQWRGTPGWEPPESGAFVDLRNCEPVQRFKQLAASNVYGFGMIMLSLMTLTSSFTQKHWLGDGPDDIHLVDAPEYRDRTSRYSEALQQMVRECIRFDPTTRITFEALLSDMETFLDVDDGDDGDNNDGDEDDESIDDERMGKATKRRKERAHSSLLDGHELVHGVNDDYVVAMTLADLQQRDPEPDLQWFNA